MLYSFEIGATIVGLTNLQQITPPVWPPRWAFRPCADQVILGDGSRRGVGGPVVTWRFGYLSRAQRDALRAFCPGSSAEVYIRTRTVDNDDTYAIFHAVMIWPESETLESAGRRLDFTLEFRQCILQGP